MNELQKVLAVDDSQTNLALLEHMLSGIECQVVLAQSGTEAVSLVKDNDFALILLDIQMPGLNGYETATRIKEFERGKHVPIIFITAIFQDDENVHQGYETGAVDYLFRPVDVHVLSCKVETFLQMDMQKVLLRDEIEQRKMTERALRTAEEKYRSIFERANEGIFQSSLQGRFMEVNPAMLQILGYDSVNEVVGRPDMWAIVMKDNEERQAYEEILNRDGRVVKFEFHGRRKDGEIIWCSLNSRVVTPDTGEKFIEGVLEDITERKNIELELKRLAMIDSLTRIANRHRFFDRLEHVLAVAKRNDSLVAVLFIDLNNFKQVNDNHGHQAGDELLRMVASRLQGRIRESDTLARIGGDEFGVLLTGIQDEEGAIIMTKSLLEVMKRPFEIQGNDVVVSATIGVSYFPKDGKDTVSLISRADAAMYGAKNQSNTQFGTFSEYGVSK